VTPIPLFIVVWEEPKKEELLIGRTQHDMHSLKLDVVSTAQTINVTPLTNLLEFMMTDRQFGGFVPSSADMLKIFTKNRQNIFYFSQNARQFLKICTKTSKYLNIYYQKRPKYFLYLALRAWRVNIFGMSDHQPLHKKMGQLLSTFPASNNLNP
jgi:hypothetical protein